MEIFYDHYFGKLSLNDQKELFQTIKVSSLLEVKTGKEDANFSNSSGKYNFFINSPIYFLESITFFASASVL